MTRDELATNVEWCLTEYADHEGSTLLDTVMEHVDKYAAAERSVIEQQIAGHVERRLVSERERIAQAIEGLTLGWITRSEAARIAREAVSTDG